MLVWQVAVIAMILRPPCSIFRIDEAIIIKFGVHPVLTMLCMVEGMFKVM